MGYAVRTEPAREKVSSQVEAGTILYNILYD